MPQTPNYNLPLFTANDVPNWLTDWNQSMTDIDSALADINAKAIGQGSSVEELQNNVSTINSSIINIGNSISAINTKLIKNDKFKNFKYLNTTQQEIGDGTGLVSGKVYTTPADGMYIFSWRLSNRDNDLVQFTVGPARILFMRITTIDYTFPLWLRAGETFHSEQQQGETWTFRVKYHSTNYDLP